MQWLVWSRWIPFLVFFGSSSFYTQSINNCSLKGSALRMCPLLASICSLSWISMQSNFRLFPVPLPLTSPQAVSWNLITHSAAGRAPPALVFSCSLSNFNKWLHSPPTSYIQKSVVPYNPFIKRHTDWKWRNKTVPVYRWNALLCFKNNLKI